MWTKASHSSPNDPPVAAASRCRHLQTPPPGTPRDSGRSANSRWSRWCPTACAPTAGWWAWRGRCTCEEPVSSEPRWCPAPSPITCSAANANLNNFAVEKVNWPLMFHDRKFRYGDGLILLSFVLTKFNFTSDFSILAKDKFYWIRWGSLHDSTKGLNSVTTQLHVMKN